MKKFPQTVRQSLHLVKELAGNISPDAALVSAITALIAANYEGTIIIDDETAKVTEEFNVFQTSILDVVKASFGDPAPSSKQALSIAMAIETIDYEEITIGGFKEVVLAKIIFLLF